MSDRTQVVMDAIKENLEYDAHETERLQRLRKVMSDEAIADFCLDSIERLFEGHNID